MKIWRHGSYGNAHFVMSKVKECLEGSDRAAEYPEVAKRMRAGTYAELCAVAAEVTFGSVEVVDDQMDADL